MDWFTVDKAGLAKLLDKKGKEFAAFELFQNAFDTKATFAEMTITPIAHRAYAYIRVVDDDPDGFKNLSHAFTLFAESEKKTDPTKRGRFNLGEKLVLALCEEACIMSTTGTVLFNAEGRTESRKCTEEGSVFTGTMRMTRDEYNTVRRAVMTLIPPEGIMATFNGERITRRSVVKECSAILPTEQADEQGYLRPTSRMTQVTIHEVLNGERATLYEMGIPIVWLPGGERWHINVHQKIPLNVDRDNVKASYLQTVRVLLANEMKDHFTKADVSEVWLKAATEDLRIGREAMAAVLDKSFGKKRATYDMTDTEANKEVMNRGYTVIPGGAFSKRQWDNIKHHELSQPSGQIAPSGTHHGDGPPERVVSPAYYTKGMAQIVEYTIDLALEILGKYIDVTIVNEAVKLPHAAWYGKGQLTFNVGRLGKDWFEHGINERVNALILHELTHDAVGDHLTREFSDEMARLFAKVVSIALKKPEFFHEHGCNPSAEP